MTRWLPVIVALGLAASGAARAECDHCPKDRAEQAGGMQAAGRTPTADGTQASGGTMEPGAAHTPGTAGSLRSAGTPYEEPDAVVGADRAHGSHGSYGAHDAEDSGDSRGWSSDDGAERYGLDYGYWREGKTHVSHDPAHIWYRGPAPRQTLFASDDDNGRWADSGKNRRWEGRSRAAGFCPHCGRRLPGGAAYGMGWGPHHYGQDYYGGPPARPGRRGYGPAWRDQREDRTWRGDWHGGKRMDPSYRKGPSTGH